MAKKTTELVLLFHKNVTKLVFLAQYGPKQLQSVNKQLELEVSSLVKGLNLTHSLRRPDDVSHAK